MSDEKAAPKPNRKLLVTQLAAAEHTRVESVATPEAGTTLDDMLKPEYWAHVARTLQVWQRIEVRAADRSWMAELVVLVVKPFAAKVHVLKKHEFDLQAAAKENVDVPEGYEIKNRGFNGWCVIRLSDKEVLHQKEPNKVSAVTWLETYLKDLAA